MRRYTTDFKREKENVLKGCNYTCVVSTPDSRNIYAVGSDKKLKEFDETNQISKVSRCRLTPS